MQPLHSGQCLVMGPRDEPSVSHKDDLLQPVLRLQLGNLAFKMRIVWLPMKRQNEPGRC